MTIQEKIAKLEKELAELKKECTGEYKIKYKQGDTFLIHESYITSSAKGSDNKLTNHGRYRHTREGAEDALKLQQKVMRLHALAEDLGALKEFVYGEKNWIITYNHDIKKYGYISAPYEHEPEKVYMTEEGAEKICELLNSGKYSLEGE